MKGYKTLLINGLLAAGVAGLQYVAGVNWTDYVSPTNAILATTIINVILRAVTSTPMFKKEV